MSKSEQFLVCIGNCLWAQIQVSSAELSLFQIEQTNERFFYAFWQHSGDLVRQTFNPLCNFLSRNFARIYLHGEPPQLDHPRAERFLFHRCVFMFEGLAHSPPKSFDAEQTLAREYVGLGANSYSRLAKARLGEHRRELLDKIHRP